MKNAHQFSSVIRVSIFGAVDIIFVELVELAAIFALEHVHQDVAKVVKVGLILTESE